MSPKERPGLRHLPAPARDVTFRRRGGRGTGWHTWVLARRPGSWRARRDWRCAGRRWWCGEAAASWPPPLRAGEGSGLGAGSPGCGRASGPADPDVPAPPGLRRAGVPRGSPATASGPSAAAWPGRVPAWCRVSPCSPSPRAALGAPLATCPGSRPLWAGFWGDWRGPVTWGVVGQHGAKAGSRGRPPDPNVGRKAAPGLSGWRDLLSGNVLGLTELGAHSLSPPLLWGWCPHPHNSSASIDPALFAFQDSRVLRTTPYWRVHSVRSAHLPGGPSHSSFTFSAL